MNKILSLLMTGLLFSCTPAFAQSTTPHFDLEEPAIGNTTTWGLSLNSNMDIIDDAIWNSSGGLNVAPNISSSSTTITLTNPLDSVQNVTLTAGGQGLVLPAMNASSSMIPGGVLTVNNVGTFAFEIFAQDGTTPVVTTLLPGETVYITLLTNGTANGTFQATNPSPSVLGTSVSSANPFISGDRTSGFYTAGAAEVDVAIGGTQVATWTSSGYTLPALSTAGIVMNSTSGLLSSSLALPTGVTAQTLTAGDSSTGVATTAFVNGTALTLTNGTTATTQSAGDNSTKVATTAYVDSIGGIGVGQTWQDVTSSRAIGTVYTNSTGKPIEVFVSVQLGAGGTNFSITIGSTGPFQAAGNGTSSLINGNASFIVPPGTTYEITLNGGGSLSDWIELR